MGEVINTLKLGKNNYYKLCYKCYFWYEWKLSLLCDTERNS